MLEWSRGRVHATRARRRTGAAPIVGDERALVEAFHPDHHVGSRSRIPFGPNQGAEAPRELVRLLVGRSLLDPGRVPSQTEPEVDLLVLGAGGAGLCAALSAHECGATVAIATKLRCGDSNTAMATGMACAVSPSDSTELHVADTLAAGRSVGAADLVTAMVEDGPAAVRWLESYGVTFNRHNGGHYVVAGRGGGHSTPRTLAARGGLTGLEIVRVLRGEINARRIPIFEYSPAVELVLDDRGRCAGAVVIQTESRHTQILRARSTVLTTGGAGQLRFGGFATTNHHGATADGLVIAYRAGARLRDIDSVQYHPTGAAWPLASHGWLLTEGLRLYGAHLVNAEGERFVDQTRLRDVVASAILRECAQGRGVEGEGEAYRGVWLDTPLLYHLHPEFQFSPVVAKFRRLGVDPCIDPLLVYPSQHYFNGGLHIDAVGRTTVPGLYAAGEAAGGAHGRNRMGGNSLLEVVTFGRRVGCAAATEARVRQRTRAARLDHVVSHNKLADRHGMARGPMLFPYAQEETVRRFGWWGA